MLLAAGYRLSMAIVPWTTLIHAKEALETLLGGHEPGPALTVDRQWNIVDTNRALAPLLEGVDGETAQVLGVTK